MGGALSSREQYPLMNGVIQPSSQLRSYRAHISLDPMRNVFISLDNGVLYRSWLVFFISSSSLILGCGV